MQGLLQKRTSHDAQNVCTSSFIYNYNAIFRIIKLKDKRFRTGKGIPSNDTNVSAFSQKGSGNRATDAAGTADYNSFFTMKNIFHLLIIPQEY